MLHFDQSLKYVRLFRLDPKGQKTYNKVMKLVKATNSKVAEAIVERNKIAVCLPAPACTLLSKGDVSEKTSWFWQGHVPPGAAIGGISVSLRKEMIHLQAQRDRAKEEVAFMREDARLALTHVSGQRDSLFACLANLLGKPVAEREALRQNQKKVTQLFWSGASALLLVACDRLDNVSKEWERVLEEMNEM